jgi:hypothetical protein
MPQLTPAQQMFLEFGLDRRWGGAFGGEEECRAAWMRERDGILAGYRNGHRPWGWWRFEAPIPYPGYDHERSTLFAAGLLLPEEARELERSWRQEFERTWSPHFFFVESGRIFEGIAGRRKHYAWADISEALVHQWSAERRRRRRTIRRLGETPAAEPPPAA